MSISDDLPAMPRGRIASAFNRPAWILAAVAVLVPNLPFAFLSIFAYPNRTLAIALYVLLALISLRAPRWLSLVLLIAVVCADVLLVISGAFDLHPSLVLQSIKYAIAFDVFASPAYLLATAILVASTLATGFLIVRHRDAMRSASLMPLLVCAAAMLAFDMSANILPSKAFAGLHAETTKFDSAMKRSGLSARFDANHNTLIVMVEGMGAFADPAHTALLSDTLGTAALESRYTVTSGTSPYVGSTTGAAARELCDTWGDFRDFMTKEHYDCLPARLKARGYDTAAFHAFTGNFFSRFDWYPRIGFTRHTFREDLDAAGETAPARLCGLTFRGLCDIDMADHVEAYMTQASDTPRFAYWLTLNTHMPIAPDEATPHLGCEDGGPFDDRMVCDMTEMWMDILQRVTTLAMNPALKNTDILVVGDHHPPLWTRHGRGLFEPGQVAWFALTAK
jgi:Sulfatase